MRMARSTVFWVGLAMLMASFGCVDPLPPPVIVEPAPIAPSPPPLLKVAAPEPEPKRPYRCDPPAMALDLATGRYCVHKVQLTWDEAERRCVEGGAHLATIDNAAEDRALRDALASPIGFEGNVWIGLVEPQEGRWLWATTQPVTFTAWFPNEPNNAGGDENCGEMYSQSGLWNDVRCDSPRGYLCELRSAPRAKKKALACSGKAFTLGAIDYCFHRDAGLTWEQARRACSGDGGELATFLTKEEHEAVRALMATRLGNDSAWIGVNDRRIEGSWEWVSGERSSYTHWRTGEPNNVGDEDCTEWFTADGAWNDVPCSVTKFAICEANRG